MFPVYKIPWSKPESNFRFLESFCLLLNVIGLSLMDILNTNEGINMEQYAILIPLLIVQSGLLYMTIYQTVAYNQIVQKFIIFRESIIWSILVTAIVIEMISDKPDFIYIATCSILIITVTATVIHYKKSINQKILTEFHIVKLGDEIQYSFMNVVLLYQQYTQESSQYNSLINLYNKHLYICQDEKCPSFKKRETDSTDHSGDLMTLSYEDLQRGLSKEYLNKSLLDILFYHLRTDYYHSRLYFLEIFIKISKFNQIFSSYYKLMVAKKENFSRIERQKYEYLSNLITIKYASIEKKHDEYDVETVMKIETEFILYKQAIANTTLQVQHFWENLLSKSIELKDLMQIGNKIVNSYIIQKECYEGLIQKKPDYSEVALYNVQFCQNVMNFEIEAIEANNVYKKIIEKNKIVQKNFYNVAKNDYALVIVAVQNGKKNQIIMANQIFEEATGMLAQNVINKNVNVLMPGMVSIVHDDLIENYLSSYNGAPYNRLFDRVWVKKSDETVLPVRVQLLTCISQTYGLLFVALIQLAFPIIFRNISYKSTQPYYLIADDEGYITNTTPNFIKKFFNGKDTFIQEFRFMIGDLFPYFNEFSDEDLKLGVETKMNKQFNNQQLDLKKQIDVKLLILKHNFKQGIKIQEVIFIENLDIMKKLSRKLTEQQQYYDGEISEYENDNNPTMMLEEDTYQRLALEINDGSINSGSGSFSSYSSNTESQKGMLSIKNMLDFKKLPQSLVNLKRAVIVFFMVMISTSIAMLSVTLVSHNQFHQDQETTKNSIYIERELSNLRLSFRMLVFISQRGDNQVFLTYDDQIHHIRQFFELLQGFQNMILDDDHQDNSELGEMTKLPQLQLEEISENGIRKFNNLTFFTGMQQFMSKVAFFLEYDEQQLIQIYDNFYLKDVMKNLTVQQRDAWFIIQNGNHNLRDFTIRLSELYLIDGKGKETGYRQTLLIICCLCIGVAILSTGILTPTLSSLDSEELNVIHKWNLIQDTTKAAVLSNINSFNLWLVQVDVDRTKMLNLQTKIIASKQLTAAQQQQQDSSDVSYNTERSFLTNNKTNQTSRRTLQNYNSKNNASNLTHDISEIQDENNQSNNTSFYEYVSGPDNYNTKSHAIEEEDKSSKQLEFSKKGQESSKKPQKNNKSIKSSLSLVKEYDQPQEKKLENRQEEVVKNEKQFEKRDIQKLFRIIKLKRTVAFALFTSIIIGFFLGQYFVTDQVIREATDSFQMQFIFSKRISCITTSLNFLLETYAENKTQEIGLFDVKLEDYILINCGDIENQIADYTRFPPEQIKYMIDKLHSFDSKQACYVQFSDQEELDNCFSKINKIMNNGLKNAFQQTYYHAINQILAYDNLKKNQITRQILNDKVYKSTTQQFMDLYFDVLMPISYSISQDVDSSIDQYLDDVLNIYFAIFGVFISFLFISLIIAFKYILIALRSIVLRTRILVKIIPIEELKQILDRKKNANKI